MEGQIKAEIERRYRGVEVNNVNCKSEEIVVLNLTMKRNVRRYISNYIFKTYEKVKAVHFEHPTENFLQAVYASYKDDRRNNKLK